MEIVIKKSYKNWRKDVRKAQRKRRRRLSAQKREVELKVIHQSQSYQAMLAQQNAIAQMELEQIQRINEIENEKWLQSEMLIEKRWLEHIGRIKEQTKAKETERKRIQEEFDAEQKRISYIAEEKLRNIEEAKQYQADLQRRIVNFINGDDELPVELSQSADTNPGKALCPFFVKTAACRFGNKCSRNHSRPKISKTLLLPSFFSNIQLQQSQPTEYGGDLLLEYDERELYRDFEEFFADVMPEFNKFGIIEQFVVCQNYEPHLQGHVYVQYSSERNALSAYQTMQGRYYAGHMINIEFCKISWKAAICGLSLKNICPKGRNCNFLHAFRNPHDQFPLYKTIQLTAKTNQESQRIKLCDRKGKNSWDFDGETIKKHWRWSDSPSKEIFQGNMDEIRQTTSKPIEGSFSKNKCTQFSLECGKRNENSCSKDNLNESSRSRLSHRVDGVVHRSKEKRKRSKSRRRKKSKKQSGNKKERKL